jgi:hypothetical protein
MRRFTRDLSLHFMNCGSERSVPLPEIGTSPNTKSNAKLNFRGFLTLGCSLEFPYLLRFPPAVDFWTGSFDDLSASYVLPSHDGAHWPRVGVGVGYSSNHRRRTICEIGSKPSIAMAIDNSLFINIRNPLRSNHDPSRAFSLVFTSSRASHFSPLLLPPLHTGQVLP